MTSPPTPLLEKRRGETEQLFYEKAKAFKLPELIENDIDDAYDEIELLKFPVTLSRFEMLQTATRLATNARNLMEYVGTKIKIMGDYVATKGVPTSRGEFMAFGTFIDEEGNFFDTVHFPPSLSKYPFKGGGIYLILGKVVEEFGFPSIEVERMEKLGYKQRS